MNTINFQFIDDIITFNTNYTIPEELVGKTLIQTDLLPSSYYLFLQNNYNYLICLETGCENMNPNLYKFFTENICLSSVIKMNIKLDADDTNFFIILDYLHENKTIILYLYNTYEDYVDMIAKQYYLNGNINVVLDLDKTLVVSSECVDQNQLSMFRTDFTIEGFTKMHDNFNYNIMIRPGVYEFLLRLNKIANVFILTAADINYARMIIDNANNMNWLGSGENVYIHLSNVFSSRKNINSTIYKTFDIALCLYKLNISPRLIGVDDDISMWHILDKKYIINISPFQPFNDSPNELLNILKFIEL